MSNLGKKILSAFVEVRDEEKPAPKNEGPDAVSAKTQEQYTSAARAATPASTTASRESTAVSPETKQRFVDYFDKLFSDANIPGPDYYEFSKMIGAMHLIADERARYFAAYAGLQVQGLDKQKLLSTAAEYLKVLDGDADRFKHTVDATVQEKVYGRSAEAEEKAKRIVLLSQEIHQLQDEIAAIEKEVRESNEKLSANGHAYSIESERRKEQIQSDIDKINQYIQ